jgi:hypothetical protein
MWGLLETVETVGESMRWPELLRTVCYMGMTVALWIWNCLFFACMVHGLVALSCE